MDHVVAHLGVEFPMDRRVTTAGILTPYLFLAGAVVTTWAVHRRLKQRTR